MRSERRRAEALAEIDRAKTAFFSNVSHEFRTPLTLMLGPLEDMLATSRSRRCPAASQARSRSRTATVCGCCKLVNSLLDFSRIEAGRVEASFQPTDLAALHRRAGLELPLGHARKRGLHLDDRLRRAAAAGLRRPRHVGKDRSQSSFQRLQVHLRGRDRRHVSTPRWRPRASSPCATPASAFPPHELPRLFERFHRVEGQRGRTLRGIRHRPRLWCRSWSSCTAATIACRQRGRTRHVVHRVDPVRHGASAGGAHARVGTRPSRPRSAPTQPIVEEALRWLPARPRRPMPASLARSRRCDAASALAPAARTARVLSPTTTPTCATMCGACWPDYDVETGRRRRGGARGDPRASGPDLVLTDVMMPALDGFGLLREVRADPALRDLPVILLSARAGEEARSRGLEAGADDYLIKPFCARELLARVNANLEMARVRARGDARTARKRSALPQHGGPCAGHDVDDGRVGFAHLSEPRLVEFTGQTLGEARVRARGHALHPEDMARSRRIFVRPIAEKQSSGRMPVEARGRRLSLGLERRRAAFRR